MSSAFLDRLGAAGVVAIVRSARPVGPAVGPALVAGGVSVLEVTLNTPDAADTISRWRTELGDDACVGAGTVRTVADVEFAVDAGAEFVISPGLDPAVVSAAQRAGIAAIAGALTPTEVEASMRAGADAVKVFPVSAMGGARYIRDLVAPLDDVPLVAVGGVDAENARAHLEAGAIAVGVGSALCPTHLLDGVDPPAITSAARALVAACRR